MNYKKVAVIGSPHGLKGYVYIKHFVQNAYSLYHYSPLTDHKNTYIVDDIKLKKKEY